MLGRLITDDIIVAYETLHSMKTRQNERYGSIAVILDITKAYDKVEWSFREAMMRKLEFNNLWISKIMTCVTTVTYATLINGQLGSLIK